MPAFGEWTPDQLDLDGASSRVARNVYAKSNSYGPVPSAQVYGTATLPAKCVGFAPYRTEAAGGASSRARKPTSINTRAALG
jgi:hypothetical protein